MANIFRGHGPIDAGRGHSLTLLISKDKLVNVTGWAFKVARSADCNQHRRRIDNTGVTVNFCNVGDARGVGG
jgi:hypothetical protein